MGWSAVECPGIVTTTFYTQTQWCLCTTEHSWLSRKPPSLLHSPTSSDTRTSAQRPPFFLGFTLAPANSPFDWLIYADVSVLYSLNHRPVLLTGMKVLGYLLWVHHIELLSCSPEKNKTIGRWNRIKQATFPFLFVTTRSSFRVIWSTVYINTVQRL